MPHLIEFNNRTITGPTAMSNVCSNYFTLIGEKRKSSIKFESPKHYMGYIPNANTNEYLLIDSNQPK